MTQIQKIDPKEYGLEEKQVGEIQKAFIPKIQERDGYVPIYNELLTAEINQSTCEKAGELRRKLVKVRTGIASIHKTQKAYFLAAGRFVDAWKNKETEPVLQMEEKLSEIEKYFEIQEQKRLEKLQTDRAEKLSKYVEDAHERNLSGMDDDVWDAYFQAKKQAWEDEQAAIKKAEQERIEREKAEAAERERIRKENEQLRKEAIERERLAKIEEEKRAAAERERIAKEESERKKREEKERKEREAYEAKLRKEREEREKIQRQIELREEAERKAKEEEEARKQAELNKGDADKVNDLISELQAIKTKYTFKSLKNKKMYEDVSNLIDKVINHIEK